MSKILENLWAKLAAVLLAFLLWFHVATDKTFQYEIDLKLNQVELPQDLALTEAPPNEFKVVVSATGKRLLRSDWKKAGLKLSIDRNYPGRFKISFDQTNLSLLKAGNIELQSIISPRDAILDCDQKIQKEVAVKSAVKITPDEGFILSRGDSLIPSKVTIAGPRSLLKEIDTVETITEHHEGVRNNLIMRIPLAHPNIYNLEISPDTVNYIVNVSPIKSRLFTDISINIINEPSQSGSDYAITPHSLELRVGGIPEIIDSLDINQISATVDFRQFDSLGFAELRINLPPSISIIEKSADSVQLIRE